MIYSVFFVAILAGLFSFGNTSLAQRPSRLSVTSDSVGIKSESDASGWNWITGHVGGDFFLNGQLYGLHLSGGGSVTRSIGLGAEIRARPVFLGGTVGFSSDEGLPFSHAQVGHDIGFYSYDLYVGAIVDEYRVEIGENYVDNVDWISRYYQRINFTTGFVGVSRKIGGVAFLEPEIKIMFPIVSHYWIGYEPPFNSGPAVEHYHVGDLFFALGLKIGFGFN